MPSDHLAAKKPRQITVGVFLDEGPADRLDEAVMARQEALRSGATGDELAAVEATLQAAQDALDEATQWFTFRAVGNRAFARLMAEHQPTAEDVAAAEAAGRDRPEFNPETFPPVLLAASCVAPVMLLEEVLDLYEDRSGWNVEELGALFAAAISVNTRARPLRVKAQT